MNLAIEIIALVGIVGVVIIFSTWKVISLYFLKRRYKPENDKSRSGEEKRLVDIGTAKTVGRVTRAIERNESYNEPPKRTPIQTTVIDSLGQNSPRNRKSQIRFRGR